LPIVILWIKVGECMRKWVLAGAALLVAFQAAPSIAGNIKFSPRTFQIYGGMPKTGGLFKRRTASFMPAGMLHHTVAFSSDLAPGSIVVRTGERKLYYVLSGGEAIQYSVGVGRDGFTWSGVNKVSGKAEWPDWRPPREMITREAQHGRHIPDYMPGGPENPLGARAIYIGDTEFRIHGTTQPWSIGQAVSSGCIRLMNEEVIDLYNRVAVGATVVVE
jgi:lipoprotein-anchoring transpeptidase ErfK/SrfK